MKMAVVGKLERGAVTQTGKRVVKLLRASKGVELKVEEEFGRMLGLNEKDLIPLDEIEVEIIVTIGGDGTILKTLEHANGAIFGINEGRLGFLTEVLSNKAEEGLRKVLDGDYVKEIRNRLKVLHNDIRVYDAINEAVIHTSIIAKMQDFNLKVDGRDVDEFRADGMIVATPTGSTGYSMSVGGPLVDPRVEAMILVPIAPFKLSARPIVVPASSTVEIRVLNPKPSVLVLDGQYEKQIKEGDVLSFTVSDKPAEFITFGPRFYEHIHTYLK
jgi:NAD+ kinase